MAYQASEEVVNFIVENHKMSDDELLGQIVQLAVPFGSAKNVLKSVLEEKGLRLSKAQRDDKAEEILSDFTPTEDTDTDEVNEAIENLVEELDCTVNIARAYVRAVFNEADIPMPKAKSGGGTKGPREPGFRGDFATAAKFALENPVAVENELEVFKEYMDANGGSTTRGGKDKSKNWIGGVLDLRIFAAQWKAAGNCQD